MTGPAAGGWPPRIKPSGRDRLIRGLLRLLVGATLRVTVEGADRLPPGPALLCFNHQSWFDPFVIIARLPPSPVLMFFGPREADMRVGWRNHLIAWSHRCIPYRPAKDNLLTVSRRAEALLAAGARIVIAPEGRIHVGESVLLPLEKGAAFLAMRGRVPLVPVAINGVGWLRFRGRVRLRVGEPIPTGGRPTKEAVAAASDRLAAALLVLTADWPDAPPPGPVWSWLTELYNDWPEGRRPQAPQLGLQRPD